MSYSEAADRERDRRSEEEPKGELLHKSSREILDDMRLLTKKSQDEDFPKITPEGTKPRVTVFYTVKEKPIPDRPNDGVLYVVETFDIYGLGAQLRTMRTVDRILGFAIDAFCKHAREHIPNCRLIQCTEMERF